MPKHRRVRLHRYRQRVATSKEQQQIAAITKTQANDSRWPQCVPSRQCRRDQQHTEQPRRPGQDQQTAGSDDMQQGRQAAQQTRTTQFDLDRELHLTPRAELEALEGHRGVGATKTERVRDSNVDFQWTRFIGAIVKVAGHILIEDVDGRR